MPGRTPNARRQRSLRTTFVHVPHVDWPSVRLGVKREFRTQVRNGNHWLTRRQQIDPPFPVVAFTFSRLSERDEQLMWLEDAWSEPLRAISPESLEREGFASRQEFKTYWIKRHPVGGWRGMSHVTVLRVRPLEPGELDDARARLFEHLYGEWVDTIRTAG